MKGYLRNRNATYVKDLKVAKFTDDTIFLIMVSYSEKVSEVVYTIPVYFSVS